MSRTLSSFDTKGYVLTATAKKLLEYNVHRKGLLIGNNSDTQVAFAIGEAPGVEDYFILQKGQVFKFGRIVPVGQLWAKGPGTIVLGEVT